MGHRDWPTVEFRLYRHGIFDLRCSRLRVLASAFRLSHCSISGDELGDDQRGGTDAWRQRRHYFDRLSRCTNPQSKQRKPARSDEFFNVALERFEQNSCRESDLAALWLRALQSFDELDGTSKLRFGAHLGRLLRMADSLYVGVLDGMLDKRLWRGYERTLADTVAYLGFQTWWATRKHWHTDEFCALIDRRIQTAKPKIYDGYNQNLGPRQQA